MEPIIRSISSLDWLNYTVLASLSIIVLAKIMYGALVEKFVLLFQSRVYFSSRELKNPFRHISSILFTIVHLIGMSLFIFMMYCNFSAVSYDNALGFQTYGIIFSFYGSLIIGKLLLEMMIGHVLNIKGMSKKFLFEKLSYSNFLGLLFLVISCIFIYGFKQSESISYGLLVVFSLLYLISLTTVFQKYREHIFSHPFYFILYFCALEIAPYFIFYKLFIV